MLNEISVGFHLSVFWRSIRSREQQQLPVLTVAMAAVEDQVATLDDIHQLDLRIHKHFTCLDVWTVFWKLETYLDFGYRAVKSILNIVTLSPMTALISILSDRIRN